MLSKIGGTEILVILVIAVLIFGPTLLPKMGKSIGKTLSGFKKGLREESSSDTPASAGSTGESRTDKN